MTRKLPLTEAQYQQRLANIQKIAANKRAATHCKEGHEFTPENIYVRPGSDRRECHKCRLERSHDYYAAKARRRLATRIEVFGV
jgi:hypothetical protein